MLTIIEANKLLQPQTFYKGHADAVKDYEAINIHANGTYPEVLIGARRPGESEAVQKYRKSIYEPITIGVIGRVFNSLNKIRRSADWAVKFAPTSENKLIKEGEGLQQYINNKLNITKWCFDTLLKELITDPNAFVVVTPGKQVGTNEYKQPVLNIINCVNVKAYKEGEYLAYKSTDICTVQLANNTTQLGEVYYIVTPTHITTYNSTAKHGVYVEVDNVVHGLGYMPVVQIKGVVYKVLDSVPVYRSRIYPMIPKLNEAIREYSDLQAEVVQHVHSEKWEYSSDDCNECKGNGIVTYPGANNSSNCMACKGTGAKPRGPYTSLVIKAPMAGEASLPTPPIGYVQKNTAIVDIQDKRIEAHIYNALCAINMQFLDTSPIAQSGIAKGIDKDELNNFVHNIAEDMVSVLDFCIKVIADVRYSTVIPDAAKRMLLLPIIPVPDKYDILSTNYLEGQLAYAKQSKFNPAVVSAMEVDYINKKYVADPATKALVSLTIELDPLGGLSEEEKTIRLANKGISQIDYTISSNITQFIKRAIKQDAAFISLAMDKQQEVLVAMAQLVLNTYAVATQPAE